MQELVTASQASQRLRVNPKAIRHWHTRGWTNQNGQRQQLNVAGHNRKGVRLYYFNELVIAERDTRQKTNRSHRRAYTTCPAM
jgi:DNA-binding transcriptional MerR regulator